MLNSFCLRLARVPDEFLTLFINLVFSKVKWSSLNTIEYLTILTTLPLKATLHFREEPPFLNPERDNNASTVQVRKQGGNGQWAQNMPFQDLLSLS